MDRYDTSHGILTNSSDPKNPLALNHYPDDLDTT